MMLTAKQALSFVDANSKGAPKHFFDALLGTGQTPKVDDFTSDDAEGLEKAEEFISCVKTVIDALTEHLRYHPKQTSLLTAFDKQKKTPTKEVMSNVFNPTADDGKSIHNKKPAKKKPTQKTVAKPAKKKVTSSMQKFKDSVGKKKPAKKSAK